ncbi:two-component system response regulator [Neobacillus dielmonensis]|uniref:two-component system response regulator n=1 Tax=Neobacillus dielmonensis TaxID=1347369 RepID=UPI0005A65CDE|nr:EAL domain-containing protein [Neobacillus dielmonensis]
MDEKVNILLVDDRVENLLALEAIIERENYQLIKAFSGEEALKYLLKYDFATILLDVQMPGMDGFETAKLIKSREKSKNIPIIFITANNMDSQHIFKGYFVGAMDYILKPFDPYILKAKVEGFVDIYRTNQKLMEQTESLMKKTVELERVNQHLNQSQELITYMAYHDGLTGLPNRRMFHDQVNQLIAEGKAKNHNLALLYMDMDHFKYINDSLGHLLGDQLLQEIAKRLKKCSNNEYFTARLGGDEFVMLLPNTSEQRVVEITGGILSAFQESFHLDAYELHVTTSIGISVFPFDGEDEITLMKNADAALYRSKEQGKNKYQFFHAGMNPNSYKKFTLQNDLRKAVEKKELRLVYQPRIDGKTGAITSVEALLRWNHPRLGMVSPLEFIPLAEETGLILEIGEWVLRTACRQNKAWQDAGMIPIRMAVNFSAKQFLQKELVGVIERILMEVGLSPEWLEIEITETCIMRNVEMVTTVLEEIKRKGIKISLDDFGTGYSSLNYLRKFPLHTLKIDKSFIQDLSNREKEAAALVAAIVSLAGSLNMTVVAEGVETEEQLTILKQLKCEEMQGYLYSPPVEPEVMEKLLTRTAGRK